MVTDGPAWTRNLSRSGGVERKPRPIKTRPAEPAGGSTTAAVVRSQAVASSHNTFRPDVYRVSEGYLN